MRAIVMPLMNQCKGKTFFPYSVIFKYNTAAAFSLRQLLSLSQIDSVFTLRLVKCINASQREKVDL